MAYVSWLFKGVNFFEDASLARGRNGSQDETPNIQIAPGITPKEGQSALSFGGEAEMAGSKGDYTVHPAVSGQTAVLGLWLYLSDDANVAQVGIQVYDAQDEALMMLVPADWQGWRWLEFKTAGDVWDETRGCGFNMPALQNENHPWDQSKLDSDGLPAPHLKLDL